MVCGDSSKHVSKHSLTRPALHYLETIACPKGPTDNGILNDPSRRTIACTGPTRIRHVPEAEDSSRRARKQYD
jgi:hypothetical protein